MSDDNRAAARALLAQIRGGQPEADAPGADNRAAARALLAQINKPQAPADDPLIPRITEGVEQIERPKQRLRDKYSEDYFATAGQAAGGLVGGEGVVDLSGSAPLMKEGGAELSVPEPVMPVVEYLGDALVTAASAGGGAYGYLAGGIGDLLVEAGVMSPQNAKRFSRDLMAMPEAVAGSPMSAARRVGRNAARSMPEVRATVDPIAGASDITDEAIGGTIRAASGYGRGARQAREELAGMATPAPEAAIASQRLGVDLPPDVLTDSRQIREAAGMTRSTPGSEASAAWRETVERATEKADEAMQELAGASDLSTVSMRVQSRLNDSRDSLRTEADSIYKSVDQAVPRGTTFEPNNIVNTLNDVIEELGGPNGMTKAERDLFALVTGAQPVTYRRLMREKSQIGRAMRRGDGPYADMAQSDLTRLYAAISDDQMANVARVGGDELAEQLRAANGLYAKAKGLEDDIVQTFGKDQQGSIARELSASVKSAAQGDTAALKRVIATVPGDLRKEAVLSAIRQATTSTQGGVTGFGFQQFTKFYSGLRRNPQAYKEVSRSIGGEADAVLRDLYEISRRVTDARANVKGTGQANQPLLQAMRAEGLIGRILSSSTGRRAISAGTSGAGGVTGGLPGAALGEAFGEFLSKAKPDRMKRAGELFRSDDFKALVESASTRQPAPAVVNRVANSRSFRRWARASGITDPKEWLQLALAALVSDGGEKPEPKQ